MTTKFKKFYSQVKQLQDYYQRIELLKGDNFNVFKLLNLQEKEEKFHTPFITDLLNPNGTHKLGSVFLEAFIEIVKTDLELDININLNKSNIFSEKYIGKISKDKAYGGKIDILINDGLINIVIENKIYADDQEKQLIRYHNYSKNNLVLFYLNIHGTQPNEISTEGRLKSGEDFFIISYKKHILPWLTRCKEKVVDYPIIRECINQYINVVKDLCGISTNSKFEINMLKLIEDNFDLSIEIVSRFNDVKFKLLEKFRTDLSDFLTEQLSTFQYTYEVGKSEKIEDRYSKLYIRESEESKVMFVVETFSGLGNYSGSLICGVLTMWDYLTDEQREILHQNNTKGWFPKRINLDENMNRNSSLKKIANDESRSLLVSIIGNKIVEFISENEEFVQELKTKIESVS